MTTTLSNKNIYLLLTTLLLVSCLALPSIAQESDDFDAFDSFDEFDQTEAIQTVWDPLYLYNVTMTEFNDLSYTYVIMPVSKGYSHIVPKPIQQGVSNAFNNIKGPIRIVNNALQLKWKRAGEESLNFLVNSTIGLGGLINVSQRIFKTSTYKEDFGQTLGHYGVGPGFYIVLPFLGPSNSRDLLGDVLDWNLNAINTLESNENIALRSLNIINRNALSPEEYTDIRRASIDFYSFMKDAYQQQREKVIRE